MRDTDRVPAGPRLRDVEFSSGDVVLAGWLATPVTAVVRPFAAIDEWLMRRPWAAIRAAMDEELADPSWTELFFGTAFLAAGSRGPQ